jgi:hypothetical protein
MSMISGISRGFLRIALTGLFWVNGGGMGAAFGQTDPLASGELEIRGSRLTLYSDAASGGTDAEQTLNVGERGLVRTCFAGPTVPCGSLVAGDPRIAGLRVEAELSGPELPQPLPLTTVPGGAFVLPSFQQEGDYTLENIRLVSADDGQVLALAMPSLAVLHVRQILLASATVRTLSLEELRARGIEITQENFQAFDFAVGFAIAGSVVEIEFPVLYQGDGLVQSLAKPKMNLDELPGDVAEVVARWKPPMIRPFRLEVAPEEIDRLEISEETAQELVFPVFGALVIPGTVTFLNQYFEAQVIVANGAPLGSSAVLERVRASLALPAGNVLRQAATTPPVAPGQKIPVTGTGVTQRFLPGEQGAAAWTVEGLRAGTHAVFVDIEGDMVRPGRDAMPVRSRVQAAVEVVDARFQLSFSHPSIVREGEEYTLFVTIANQSQAAQNLITVEIRDESLVGAIKSDPDDDFRRIIQTLGPGASETVEFELVSQLTGQVVASAFQADSTGVQGVIRLRTGVGELGIPLSPATLVMPRFTEELEARSAELVRSHVRLLGLAHSLAVAPAALMPPGVASVNREEAERKAIDLAEAGERLFLGEGYFETVAVLALDQLGNRHEIAGYDALRRQTAKGWRAAAQIAAAWREEQASRSLDADDLFDAWIETTSYANPYLAVLSTPVGAGALPNIEVLAAGGAPGRLAGFADDEAALVRSLPWAEMFALSAEPFDEEPRAALALVGRVGDADRYQVLLRNDAGVPTTSRLRMVVPDVATGRFREIDFGVVTLPAGVTLAVEVGAEVADPSEGGFQLRDLATGVPRSEAAIAAAIPLPPFRIVGSRQGFLLDLEIDVMGNLLQPNRYGTGITYLFNRPPSSEVEAHPEAWRIVSSFEGVDVLDQPASGVTDKRGVAVYVQPNSERVAIVRYDGGISPLLKAENAVHVPLSEHEHDLERHRVTDRDGEQLAAQPAPPAVDRSPFHTGGLIGGRVIRGSGEVGAGATVQLVRQRWFETPTGSRIYLDLASTTTADAEGRFFFDFVEAPMPDGHIKPEILLRAIVPAGSDAEVEPEERDEVPTVIRQLNKVANLNIALLGRGTVRGHLVYLDDPSPVPGGRVRAGSTLFGGEKVVEVGSDGAFQIAGLPVGPIQLVGTDAYHRVVYGTVEIAGPGSVVDGVVLELQRQAPPPALGRVRGEVLRFRDGVTEPALGARVAIYSEGRQLASVETQTGSFFFDHVPSGQVTVQAADFRRSRVSVLTDLILLPGDTAEVELRIPEGGAKTLTGLVLHRDGANPPTAVAGARVTVAGPGNFATTGADGRYTLEGVPTKAPEEAPYRLVVAHAEHGTIEIELPPILETSPDPVQIQSVIYETASSSAAVRGVFLDSLGRPLANADIVLYPYLEGRTESDGSFAFEELRGGDFIVVAHVGDGLTPGQVGYFAEMPVKILAPSHQPFVEVRAVGAGTVRVRTRTSSSPGVQTPIYYRPTYYSDAAKRVVQRGTYLEATTDPNGLLELELPVGAYEILAYNPFYGTKTVHGAIEAIGEIDDIELVFEDAGKVRGVVLEPDGVTPVVDAEIVLHTGAFLPQTLYTDGLGQFLFELVPEGNVQLTARATTSGVERVGRTLGAISLPGQEIDVQVVLKRQGSIRGRILESLGTGGPVPLVARYHVEEGSFPFRRLPAESGTFYVTDDQGNYEVGHLFAGDISVVAHDIGELDRTARVRGTLVDDWSVVAMPDVVFSAAAPRAGVAFLVRDPSTGAPVPDAVVRLSTGDATVAGADGVAHFAALPLNVDYRGSAFHAPTGRLGKGGPVRPTLAGEEVQGEIYLDIRGEVRGTLFADPGRTQRIAGADVQIDARTISGDFRMRTTTSGQEVQRGRFAFLGLPEGSFSLVAAPTGTPRRAVASAALTETAPSVELEMVLEQIGDVHFRLDEKLTAGVLPVDPANGVFSLRAWQPANQYFNLYDFTRIAPEPGGNLYVFPDMLLERPLVAIASELTGDQRQAQGSAPSVLFGGGTLVGGGSAANPFRLQLQPKGTVRVLVRDGNGLPVANATVRISGTAAAQSGATDAAGAITFAAVTAGTVHASATKIETGFGGTASGTLTFDDQLLELTVQVASAVSATGRVYAPPQDDVPIVDTSLLMPKAGAIVTLTGPSTVAAITGEDGSYRFDGLRLGSYTLRAQDAAGDQLRTASVTLAGADGSVQALPDLILDASPPRILQITPAPGATGVSRTTTVEIQFSEPLLSAVLPVGPSSTYFSLKGAGGVNAIGNWSHFVNAQGRQVVRFLPSQPLANLTQHSLTIVGGANGVRDRQLRPLTVSGNVGSSFRTSDSVGPTILATVPGLARPIPPGSAIRLDFSERITLLANELDGLGNDEAARLEAQRFDGSWVALPLVSYLTRNDFSLQVELPTGLEVENDSLRRRLTVSRARDASGNPMAEWIATFRLYDEHAPILVALPAPAGVTGGMLFHGQPYSLLPQLTEVDDVSPTTPGGDLDRVEYFLSDPTLEHSTVQPASVVRSHPFAFAFTAAYAGDGTTPRPFPVWARAVDTSENASNYAMVALQVLPNAPPQATSATAEAISPVAGTFYAGSRLRGTVHGVADPDSAVLTFQLELRPLAGGAALATASSTLNRPAGGWAALAPPSLELVLPAAHAEGEQLLLRAIVIDGQGLRVSVDTPPFLVADDATPPIVEGGGIYRISGNNHVLDPALTIADLFRVRARAVDGQTSIVRTWVDFDNAALFPGEYATRPSPGNPLVLETDPPLTAPWLPEEQTVVAYFNAEDAGGNVARQAIEFTVGPANDSLPPAVEWQTPWADAPWPAAYDSLLGRPAIPLLVRVLAIDVTQDANFNLQPGQLARVEIRGPRLAAGGAVQLAEEWTAASLVPGSAIPGGGLYQLIWPIPNDLPAGTALPFEARALDTGGQEAIFELQMLTVPARRVYEGVVAAVAADDPMQAPGGDENGPVFLLDGSTLAIVPRADGGDRELAALHLYAGAQVTSGAIEVRASRLTTPEITSLDSVVTYNPLRLAIGSELGVGSGCAIDVTGRGPLGGTLGREIVTPSLPSAPLNQSASHGGLSWNGSAATLQSFDRLRTYGSVRRPHLPGLGARSNDTGTFVSAGGGAGGGVIHIAAPAARLVLAGDLLASGTERNSLAGAGGSIDLVVGTIEGDGAVVASGGGSGSGPSLGGGGRIALHVTQNLGEFDPVSQLRAWGGSSTQGSGGAGTVYVGWADEQGEPVGNGRLLVGNGSSGQLAAPTPLPAIADAALLSVDAGQGTLTLDAAGAGGDLRGTWIDFYSGPEELLGRATVNSQHMASTPSGLRLALGVEAPAGLLATVAGLVGHGGLAVRGIARYDAVEARGLSRLWVKDDLEVGWGFIANNPEYIRAFAPAAIQLRGQGPRIVLHATPAGDVRPGAALRVDWTATDPLGLTQIGGNWSFGAPTAWTGNPGSQLRQVFGNQTRSLPLTQAPGAQSFDATVRGLTGEVATATLHWNVLSNQPPSGVLTAQSLVQLPGGAFVLTVAATDAEALASIELLAPAPLVAQNPVRTASGTSASRSFFVQVPAQTELGDYVVGARVRDAAGAETDVTPIILTVGSGTPPTGDMGLPFGAPATYEVGTPLRVVVSASDVDSDFSHVVVRASGTLEGELSKPAAYGSGFYDEITFTVAPEAAPGSAIELEAFLHDQLGNVTPVAGLSVTVSTDTTPPAVSLPGSIGRLVGGQRLDVGVAASDNRGLDRVEVEFDGQTQAFDLEGPRTWNGQYLSHAVATRIEDEVLPIVVRATDVSGLTTESTQWVAIGPDRPPHASISFASDDFADGVKALLPGGSGSAFISFEDDVALASAQVVITGAAQASAAFALGAVAETERSVPFQVSASAALGDEVEILVTVIDSAGQTFAQTLRLEVSWTPDPAPDVELYLDPDRPSDVFYAGEMLDVYATARDNGLDSFRLRVGDQVHTGERLYGLSFTLPDVAAPTELTIEALATDDQGQSASRRRTLTLLPREGTVVPAVEITCPSDGAALPLGATFEFAVETSATEGVARVELFEGNASVPLAVIEPQEENGIFGGRAVVQLPATAGNRTYRAVATTFRGATATRQIAVEMVDAVDIDPTASLDPAALAGADAVLRSGTLRIDQPLALQTLIVMPGAKLSHSIPSREMRSDELPPVLDLEVSDRFYLACGAAIDVTAKGLHAVVDDGVDPDAGGVSVAFPRSPQTPGTGAGESRGGGSAHLSGPRLILDGDVLANADQEQTAAGGGGGGSIWLEADLLGGSGALAAQGATSADPERGSGAGGMVSLQYGSTSGKLLDGISVMPGAGARPGVAGKILLHGPEDTWGRLVVEGSAQDGATQGFFGLPTLASFGFTQNGDEIIPYGPNGDIYEAFSSGFAFLEGEILRSQGVADPSGVGPVVTSYYRVREVLLPVSGDDYGFCPPLACDPTVENCRTDHCYPATPYGCPAACDPQTGESCMGADGCNPITFEGCLCQIAGGIVATPDWMSSAHADSTERRPLTLKIELIDGLANGGEMGFEFVHRYDRVIYRGDANLDLGTSDIRVAAVEGRLQTPDPGSRKVFLQHGSSFAPETSFLQDRLLLDDLIVGREAIVDADGVGYVDAVHQKGGSHLGLGGRLTAAPAYGVETFDDFRGPTRSGGGSAVRIESDTLYLAGKVSADAQADSPYSGGSIYVRTNVLGGSGAMEAKGGAPPAGFGGGGGAIAIYYGQQIDGSWLEHLSAAGGQGGPGKASGGAGTVFLFGPDSTWGDLLLDNGGVAGGGTDLVRPAGAGGDYYRLDSLTIRGGAAYPRIASGARLDVAGEVEIRDLGALTLDPASLDFDALRLGPDVVARPPAPTSTGPAVNLTLELSGDLVLEDGARIDASGNGPLTNFGTTLTTPAANHLGFGYSSGPADRGATFDNPRRPTLGGGGAAGNRRGGGAVRITARDVVLEGPDSAIVANGISPVSGKASAGGAVWISAERIAGEGFIEARGGTGAGASGWSGGGGAIAVEFDQAEGAILDRLDAQGGGGNLPGGAGTVYLFSRPVSTFGDVIFDNDLKPGVTAPPGLTALSPTRIAKAGTTGTSLIVDIATVPSYFVGHEVEVFSSAGALKGIGRIGAIVSAGGQSTLQLVPEAGQTLALLPGDTWRAFYRFDSIEIWPNVSVEASDELRGEQVIVEPAPNSAPAGALAAADPWSVELPEIDPNLVEVAATEVPGVVRVRLPPSAVKATPGIAWARLRVGERTSTRAWSATEGASFLWAGGGEPVLEIMSSSPEVRRGASIGLAATNVQPMPSFLLEPETDLLEMATEGAETFVLVARGTDLALWRFDLQDGSAERVASWPQLHRRHHLLLREGIPVVIGRDSAEDLPDAAFRFDREGGEPEIHPVQEFEP